MLIPGEILVRDDRIVEVGSRVAHPQGAEIIDLGDRTLLPGLIGCPRPPLLLTPGRGFANRGGIGAAKRTILATIAARQDLMAGFTRSERDMWNRVGLAQLRISGNAIDILGVMRTRLTTTRTSTFSPRYPSPVWYRNDVTYKISLKSIGNQVSPVPSVQRANISTLFAIVDFTAVSKETVSLSTVPNRQNA